MSDPNPTGKEGKGDSFARQAEEDSTGLVREFVDFLKYNKKWWLLPILLVLVVVGALVMLTSTAAAPFIYTLF